MDILKEYIDKRGGASGKYGEALKKYLEERLDINEELSGKRGKFSDAHGELLSSLIDYVNKRFDLIDVQLGLITINSLPKQGEEQDEKKKTT